jgi:deoxyribodipyrimidine photo-lyase
MIRETSAKAPVIHSIVWFKRDLRVHDHEPLWQAACAGPIRCIYIIEPTMWALPDAARAHYEFLRESLRDLQTSLAEIGGQLEIITGEAVEVLERLHTEGPFHSIYSHQETGHHASYQRDIAVSLWCRQRNVHWRQFRQFGVVRGVRGRAGWQRQWESLMAEPQRPAPRIQSVTALVCDPSAPRAEYLSSVRPTLSAPPAYSELGLDSWDPPLRQRGGRKAGHRLLTEFIQHRGRSYRGSISSPLTASSACSRLSPYLALGCVSMRETFQQARHRSVDADERMRKSLQGFISRLYWHCHFIQKLESEPEIESHNMHRGYDGLREDDWNPRHFEALIAGRTGWPLVDACVAMLRQTGWLNFRMRAMLVSVAAYPLWLHWRPVGLWLAREFLDYEPGIHWSQMQMQSGTTGINTTRIYNPVKQARDHDPQGLFVKRWLPHLRRVPSAWIIEPWKMPESLMLQHGLHPGREVVQPLMNIDTALREAAAKMYARRRQPEVRAARERVIDRHASPDSSPFSNDRKRESAAATPRKNPAQMQLDL